MEKHVRKEIYCDSLPDVVWESLTNPLEISAWLMPTSDFKPEVGHRFMLQAKPMGKWDGKIYGQVLLADPPHKLSYTWKGDQMKSNTVLTWTLTPKGQGTHLVLEHTGFKGFGDYILGIFHAMGWKRFMKQLKQRAEHGQRKV